MSENSHRKSAKIYQFPAGGRATWKSQREPARPAVVDQLPFGVTKVAAGSAWYHDAAIEDADKGRKR